MYRLQRDKYDINLWFVVFLFAVISCYAIYHAQQLAQYETNFIPRQLIFFGIAAGIAFMVTHIDYEYYRKAGWIIYGLGLLPLAVLVVAPESVAPTINGANRWFSLAGFQIQPSELTKLSVLILLSLLVEKHHRQYAPATFQQEGVLLLKLGAVTLPPIGFLMLQPDMGTVMQMLALLLTVALVSGVSALWLGLIVGIPALLFLGFLGLFYAVPGVLERLLFPLMSEYQVSRIEGWLQAESNVNQSFQVDRAMSLIGSGQLQGNNLPIYIPEAHTDFIFAIIGHQHGFIGTAGLLCLYFVLAYLIIRTALLAQHTFGQVLCAGVLGLFAFQVFQNIGMNLGLLPVTGFPLPFVSYGGSSLIAAMLALGLVMSVRYHHRPSMFVREN